MADDEHVVWKGLRAVGSLGHTAIHMSVDKRLDALEERMDVVARDVAHLCNRIDCISRGRDVDRNLLNELCENVHGIIGIFDQLHIDTGNLIKSTWNNEEDADETESSPFMGDGMIHGLQCPKCGSLNISYNGTLDWEPYSPIIGGKPTAFAEFVCNDCNNSFMVNDKSKK